MQGRHCTAVVPPKEMAFIGRQQRVELWLLHLVGGGVECSHFLAVWGMGQKTEGPGPNKAPSGVVWGGEGTGRVWIHTFGDLGSVPRILPPFLTRPLPSPSPPAPTHQHRPPPQRIS